MQAADDVHTLLTPIGYQSGDCGYCKDEETGRRAPDSRASYYATAKTLAPEHYQTLMNRGWRRSGKLLYLPDAARSCCPHYTIRLPASEFHPGKDHRQTLNRWNRFVLGEKFTKSMLAKVKTKEAKRQERDTFDLSATVHASETSHLDVDIEGTPDHHFEAALTPDTFTNEKFDLFYDYQQHVHHENPSQITKPSFRQFLCESPLQRRTDSTGKLLGSYHHCYRLDGRLIAMSVLDLLPHAVSGVYFIYHRDFEKWSLGKLSALRELALAREERYEYYYMGYYIHSCLKMRYKGTYRPQYVLDFESFEFDMLDEDMKRLMETRKWISMSREREHAARQIKDPSASGEMATSSGATARKVASDIAPPYPTYRYPLAIDAANAGLSLVTLGMPGVLSLSELLSTIDLNAVKLRLGRAGVVHRMDQIAAWNEGSEEDQSSIKGIIAELAACLGAEMTRSVILDFGR